MSELEANWLDKAHAFAKEKTKSLTERLHGPVWLSDVDNIKF